MTAVAATPGARDRIERDAWAAVCALAKAGSIDTDRELRARILQCVRSAHDEGFSLDLSEPESPLGALMLQANNRSRARGWV